MNKEVCQQCYKRFYLSNPWERSHDMDWDEGSVMCPVRSSTWSSKLQKHRAVDMDYALPPEWCLMKLEQLVMDQKPC